MTKAKYPPRKLAAPIIRGPGQPTVYRADFCRQATNFCLLGATNEMLAKHFNISLGTLELWLRTHVPFLRAVKEGREEADANIGRSLYERARGYSHPEVHISTYLGDVTETQLTKHYPPDTAAAIIWLKNRRPDLWRARDAEAGDMGGLDAPPPVRVIVEFKDARKKPLTDKE